MDSGAWSRQTAARSVTRTASRSSVAGQWDTPLGSMIWVPPSCWLDEYTSFPRSLLIAGAGAAVALATLVAALVPVEALGRVRDLDVVGARAVGLVRELDRGERDGAQGRNTCGAGRAHFRILR